MSFSLSLSLSISPIFSMHQSISINLLPLSLALFLFVFLSFSPYVCVPLYLSLMNTQLAKTDKSIVHNISPTHYLHTGATPMSLTLSLYLQDRQTLVLHEFVSISLFLLHSIILHTHTHFITPILFLRTVNLSQ